MYKRNSANLHDHHYAWFIQLEVLIKCTRTLQKIMALHLYYNVHTHQRIYMPISRCALGKMKSHMFHFERKKSHSVTFPVCAYMLHDNLAKLLWNIQLKTKILSHGYKHEENKFCDVSPFKKIALEWVEFFRCISKENSAE